MIPNPFVKGPGTGLALPLTKRKVKESNFVAEFEEVEQVLLLGPPAELSLIILIDL